MEPERKESPIVGGQSFAVSPMELIWTTFSLGEVSTTCFYSFACAEVKGMEAFLPEWLF